LRTVIFASFGTQETSLDSHVEAVSKPQFNRERKMTAKTPREVFLILLSNVRQASEKAEKIYQEIGQVAPDPQLKEALDARAWVSGKTRAALDKCFEILGEQPVKLSGRLQEMLLEDFREQLAEIQSPIAKRIFALVKLNHLAHWRIGEYEALVAASDAVGHSGVALLLETCLADKLAFVERTRRMIRERVETKLAERAASA
jgi:ferritin-like metal-binding protein YciE